MYTQSLSQTKGQELETRGITNILLYHRHTSQPITLLLSHINPSHSTDHYTH